MRRRAAPAVQAARRRGDVGRRCRRLARRRPAAAPSPARLARAPRRRRRRLGLRRRGRRRFRGRAAPTRRLGRRGFARPRRAPAARRRCGRRRRRRQLAHVGHLDALRHRLRAGTAARRCARHQLVAAPQRGPATTAEQQGHRRAGRSAAMRRSAAQPRAPPGAAPAPMRRSRGRAASADAAGERRIGHRRVAATHALVAHQQQLQRLARPDHCSASSSRRMRQPSTASSSSPARRPARSAALPRSTCFTCTPVSGALAHAQAEAAAPSRCGSCCTDDAGALEQRLQRQLVGAVHPGLQLACERRGRPPRRSAARCRPRRSARRRSCATARASRRRASRGPGAA